MQRWLALTMGLAVAGLTLYMLAAGGGEKPMGRIGSDSRQSLEQVLEAADRK